VTDSGQSVGPGTRVTIEAGSLDGVDGLIVENGKGCFKVLPDDIRDTGPGPRWYRAIEITVVEG
jgi:hypothetical protein